MGTAEATTPPAALEPYPQCNGGDKKSDESCKKHCNDPATCRPSCQKCEECACSESAKAAKEHFVAKRKKTNAKEKDAAMKAKCALFCSAMKPDVYCKWE